MATFERKQVVINSLISDRADDMTHRTVSVTKTATMSQGSALVAAGTEAALLDVANVTGILDDLRIDNAATGDVVLVRVAHSFCKFKTANIHYSNAGAFVPASATKLAVLNQFA